jgi:Trypsin
VHKLGTQPCGTRNSTFPLFPPRPGTIIRSSTMTAFYRSLLLVLFVSATATSEPSLFQSFNDTPSNIVGGSKCSCAKARVCSLRSVVLIPSRGDVLPAHCRFFPLSPPLTSRFIFVPKPSRLVPWFAFPAGSGLCGASLIWSDLLVTAGTTTLASQYAKLESAHRTVNSSLHQSFRLSLHYLHHSLNIAAHCQGLFNDGVVIGGNTLYGTGATLRALAYEIPHPQWDNALQQNDIMLVKIASPVSIPPALLNFDAALPAVNTSLTVIGYGKNGTADYTIHLQRTTVNAISTQTCRNVYGSKIRDDLHLCTHRQGHGKQKQCQKCIRVIKFSFAGWDHQSGSFASVHEIDLQSDE